MICHSDIDDLSTQHGGGPPTWSFPHVTTAERSVDDRLGPMTQRPQVVGPNRLEQDIPSMAEGLRGRPGTMFAASSIYRVVFHVHTAETFQQPIQPVSEDRRYWATCPIIVDVSDVDGDGIYVVSDRFSTVFGSGETPQAAIADYADQLFVTFEGLTDEEASLGGALRKELDSLRQYVAHT